ncbi:spermidine/putrescine ABC transporter ATP-binding protein [Salipiger aestuarii]|uniref:ABC-type Fe3+/spermidine/putrescine transport system ATPase subunit n=1 Tax=Salipiger aestuarii TaxID=568098 RepID=A0A327Y079_9RHOB|nr:ABC transporter ATP-binding protein [Salipiger aestuarii]KAA8605562.1 spermidine/putrescine ABC transporter ATP-binding protein [Salipiger aestuarii]KAB2541180.1 spermidine/putrescine ABC transporter ATP-binding protein [Salipiger aestuarii]RAK13817.1 ABC-type Fe3+/spermidine/putrescine transport system ATPase subunit [Salipiger aestuarii]
MIGTVISIDRVEKRFGTFTALHGVSVDIADNEFFTLLGPSGCGKTTLLRCIAGFEPVSGGQIRLNGEDIAPLPPYRRPVNTVFQHYALFPHMTVLENAMFGLQRLGWGVVDAEGRARQALELVHLSAFLKRRPGQLSGGQQQRVALARALAPEPRVLLLDEPLSALDLKLRQAVRMELKQIQRETGIAFVFVTHDQEEALTMSDRIAVMSDGRVQQVGTPREIYESPANRFVADFIGETNLIEVPVLNISNGLAEVSLPGGRAIQCPTRLVDATQGVLSVRPERIDLCAPSEADLIATAGAQVYLGTDIQLKAHLAGGEQMTVRLQNAAATVLPQSGARLGLRLEAGAARLLAA